MNEPVIGTEGLGQALRYPLLEGLHVGHVAVLAAASLVLLLLALTAFSCRDVAVWTRLAVVAAAAIVIYARGAIGGWWTLGACALIVVWLWLNTRVFPPVEDAHRWESQAIFGEVLWLERANHDLPDHHLRWTRRIVTGSVIAMVPMVHGLVVFDPWATAFGATGVIVGQLWFLDRLAWLYADATAAAEGAAGSGS